MLILIPKSVPSLALLLEDLGNPAPAKVAKALGVSLRTVQRWVAIGEAPRAAMLALFWVTRWGQSAVDAETYNCNQMHAQMARALRDEVAELTGLLAKVGRIADFGSANDPARQVGSHGSGFSRPPRAPGPSKAGTKVSRTQSVDPEPPYVRIGGRVRGTSQLHQTNRAKKRG